MNFFEEVKIGYKQKQEILTQSEENSNQILDPGIYFSGKFNISIYIRKIFFNVK